MVDIVVPGESKPYSSDPYKNLERLERIVDSARAHIADDGGSPVALARLRAYEGALSKAKRRIKLYEQRRQRSIEAHNKRREQKQS